MKAELIARAKAIRAPDGGPARVVFPEGDDPRIIEAAKNIRDLGMANPLLISANPENPFQICPQQTAQKTVQTIFDKRRHKWSIEQAQKAAEDPLFQAAALVAQGDAEACVAGAVRTTSDTVRAAIQIIGPKKGNKTVSSFFLMIWPDRCLLYADCGVIPSPTSDQLVDITRASMESWQLLCESQAKAALLAFSTKGSAKDTSLEPIEQALASIKSKWPDLLVDGELQADAALIPEIGAKKAPGSPVAGQANVLIFPNLHAGNIAYKLSERLAGATALGPVLQGLANPMNDLSRGCNSEDIVLVSAISLLQTKTM